MIRKRTTKTRNSLLLTLAAFSLFLTACGDGSSGDDNTSLPEEIPNSEVDPVQDNEPTPGPDAIVFLEPEPTDQDNFELRLDQDIINEIESDGLDQSFSFLPTLAALFGAAVDPLNAIDNVFFNMTIPVELFVPCGQANAFYLPNERQIVVCEELFEPAFELLLPASNLDIDFTMVQSTNTLIFILYQQMTRALDAIRDLQIDGNFESTADAIGVVLSVQTGQPLAAINGSFFFLSDPGDVSFFDENSTSADRASNILCSVLGSSTELSAQFPNLAETFNNAGRDCVGEYAGQFQLVASLLPNLSSIQTVVSPPIPFPLTQAEEQERFAGLDRVIADLLTQ